MEVKQLPMVPEQIDRYTPMVQLLSCMVHRECCILGTMHLCYTPMVGPEECHGTADAVYGT